MSLGTWVQLIRNFLCVTKTLSPTTIFYMQSPFPTAIFPINNIRLIEFLIAVTQLVPVFLLIRSSFSSFSSGRKDYYHYQKLLKFMDQLSIEGGTRGCVEYTILRQSISRDIQAARTRQLCGIWEFVIGCSFIFLVQNSLHLHGPTHPAPLFFALLAMEIGLLYFLTLMWNGYKDQYNSKFKLESLLSKLQDLLKKLKEAKTLMQQDFTELRMLQIASDIGYIDNLIDIYKVLDLEFPFRYRTTPLPIEGVRADLGQIHIFLDYKPIELANDSSLEKDKVKEEKLIKALIENKINLLSDRLLYLQETCRVESLIQFALFAVNFIAFYGYMMAVLSFFFPNASMAEDSSYSEYFAKLWMLGLSNDAAMYYGVLAGDIAWTVEPLLVLFIFPIMRQQKVEFYLSTLFSQSLLLISLSKIEKRQERKS